MRSSKASSYNGYSSGMEVVLHIKEIIDFLAGLKNKVTVSNCIHVFYPMKGFKLFSWVDDNLVAIDRFRKETYRVYGVLELQLSGKYTGQPKEFLAGKDKGKYSIADIGTWAWVKNWPGSGFTEEEMKEFPSLLQWIERIAERPAVKRGIGEKYIGSRWWYHLNCGSNFGKYFD